jgi:hypothetical protein
MLAITIVRFFIERMESHSCVESCRQLNIEDEFIFELERTAGRPAVKIYLSDAYDYGLGEYLSRPRGLGRGDFILIARPEAHFDESVVERARIDGIGVGRLKKLMGALNWSQIWKYSSPEEKA